MNTPQELAKATGLTLVHHATSFYGGYEWREFAAYIDPEDGRWFWIEDRGCSCNYFLDDVRPDRAALQSGDRAAALCAATAWEPFMESPTDDVQANLLKAIRDYRTGETR
jgi:hypothetical protein